MAQQSCESVKASRTISCFNGLLFPRTKSVVDTRKEEMKKALRLHPKYFFEMEESVMGDIFSIGKKLGEGSFGSVYSAVRKSDKKLVALKYLQEDEIIYFWNQEGPDKGMPMEMYVQKLVKDIDGVIALLDIFSTPDGYVLVTEQPPPPVKSLHDYMIDKHGPISERKARNILKQVLRIMTDVTKAGVYHQDLKAKNLLIEPKTGKIHLIDFGAAQLVAQAPYYEFYGTAVNKPCEIVTEGWCQAESATVWSVGILAYKIMMDEFPFGTHKEIREAKLEYKNRYGIGFRDFIAACLTRDPTVRPTLATLYEHPWINEA